MPIAEKTYYVAKCDECEWEGNPTANKEDAEAHLDHHKKNDPKLGTDEKHGQ